VAGGTPYRRPPHMPVCLRTSKWDVGSPGDMLPAMLCNPVCQPDCVRACCGCSLALCCAQDGMPTDGIAYSPLPKPHNTQPLFLDVA
jgi:hypothetical protein